MLIRWSSNLDFAHLNCSNSGTMWDDYLGLVTDCNWATLPSIFDPPNNDTKYSYNCTEKQCISSTLNCPMDADCIINCIERESCPGATINCPINGNCKLVCDEWNACYSVVIHGPKNHAFEVHCLSSGCKEMQIHAGDSGFFKFIAGNHSIASTRRMSIYFPPKDEVTHNKKAQVIALRNDEYNGLDGYYGYLPFNLYAIHGWLDVDVIYGAIDESHGAIMHCNINYTDSCWVANDSWTCTPSNTICDNPFNETMPPTMSPTYSQTIEPTLEPSYSSTLEPTYPSFAPSYSPSLEPTFLFLDLHTSQLMELDLTNNTISEQTTIIIVVSVSLIVLLIIGIIIAWRIKNKSKGDKRPYENVSVDDGKQDTINAHETEMQGLNDETK